MTPENDKMDGTRQVTIIPTSKVSRQILLENENNDQNSRGVVSLVMDL